MLGNLFSWLTLTFSFWVMGVLILGIAYVATREINKLYEEKVLRGWKLHLLIIVFGFFATYLLDLPPFREVYE